MNDPEINHRDFVRRDFIRRVLLLYPSGYGYINRFLIDKQDLDDFIQKAKRHADTLIPYCNYRRKGKS